MDNLSNIEKKVSNYIMHQDCKSIFSLLETEKDSIFAMEVLPYYALFVKSYQDYIGEDFLDDMVASELKDIRNNIKSYAERFGKSKKKVRSVDNEHDAIFKERLCFKFFRNHNMHYNFGSYWTDDKYIIGNTYQLAEFLSIKSISDPNLGGKFYKIGKEIGTFISGLQSELTECTEEIERERKNISIKYCCDSNTNRHSSIFNSELSKELNLFFINLLCNMNFVKHILRKLFIDGNLWAFRVEYIVTYYTYRALERLKNYCDNNDDILIEKHEILGIVSEGKNMFSGKLRNCMMHYSLEGENVIDLENISNEFFGIIENCFDGMSYEEYLKSLHQYSDAIIKYLENQFDFSDVKLKN